MRLSLRLLFEVLQAIWRTVFASSRPWRICSCGTYIAQKRKLDSDTNSLSSLTSCFADYVSSEVNY